MFPALRGVIGGFLAGGVFRGIWDCRTSSTEETLKEAVTVAPEAVDARMDQHSGRGVEAWANPGCASRSDAGSVPEGLWGHPGMA